jgi:hypothetical protein
MAQKKHRGDYVHCGLARAFQDIKANGAIRNLSEIKQNIFRRNKQHRAFHIFLKIQTRDLQRNI